MRKTALRPSIPWWVPGTLILIFTAFLLLLAAAASAQSVPNGTITQGQIWTTAQWNTAFQAKADVTSGTLTGPTINGGTLSGSTLANPTITGGALTAPTISGLSSSSVSPSGTLPSTSFSYNPLSTVVSTTTDNAADLTGNGTNIPSLFVVDELFGGSNINDGRNALTVFQDLKVPTSPSNAYRFYVGLNSLVQAEVNDHGTSGSPQGVLEAVTGSPILTAGATNWFGLIGAEFTISADAGSSVATKAIILLDEFPTDVVHGTEVDSYIDIQAHAGAVGMFCGICFDANAGTFPLSTSATAFRLIGTSTIFNGIDFGGETVTSNVLQWNNGTYFLSGVGNANLAQGVFNAASAVALTANGVAGEYGAQINNGAATGTSFGLKVQAGTTAADVTFAFLNQAGTAAYLLGNGDGGITTNGQTDEGFGSINAGTVWAGGNFLGGGATFTIASGCATTSAITGNARAGSFTTTATTCAPVINLPGAPHGWSCNAKDITHPVNFTQTASSVTSCTVSGATTSGDTIVFDATAY